MAQSKVESKLKENTECEAKLLAEGNNTSLEVCTLANFSKCQKGQLEAFIKVRKYPTVDKKSNPDFVMPSKKGSLVDATAGVNNMIKLAFDLRTEKIIMQSETTSSGTSDTVVAPQPQPIIVNL